MIRGAEAGGRRVRRRRRVQPVAAPLEGIARKLGPPGARALEQRAPVDRRAVGPQPRQRGHERLGLVALGAERGDDQRSRSASSRHPCAIAASTPPGPSSTIRRTPARSRKAIPSANRTAPRACRTQYPGERASSSVSSSPVTFDTTATAGGAYSSDSATFANSSSIGSISGEWNAWLTCRRLVLPPLGAHRSATRSTAASAPDTTTARGPLTAASDTSSPRPSATSSSVASMATIAPPAGERAHQPAARGDETARVRQRPHAGDVRGGQLADRVADEHVGPDAERLDEPEQRDLEREQRRLGEPRLVEQRARRVVEHDLLQRPLQPAVELGAHRVERGREDRERLVQPAAHPRPLRALTRQQERELASAAGLPLDHRGGGLAAREGPQTGEQLLPPRGHHRRAALQPRPARRQRERRVGHRELRMLLEMRDQPLGLPAQRVLAARRHQQRDDRHLRALGRRRGRRLLDDHVRVRPADPERRDARAPRALAPRPRLGLGQQLHVAGRPVDLGGRLVDVQRGRQLLVAQRLDDLDDARHAGGRLRVPDVRLDRAEPQRARSRAPGRRWRAAPAPRSGRRASCPSRDPRRRRPRRARGRRSRAPGGSPAPATARSAR
jgi:hypothetical protein